MHLAVYAIARLILLGIGWSLAGLLGVIGEMMLGGLKWPVFGALAAWWTFACAVYVNGESGAQRGTRRVPDAPERVPSRINEILSRSLPQPRQHL
jgi:hypothetical protein